MKRYRIVNGRVFARVVPTPSKPSPNPQENTVPPTNPAHLPTVANNATPETREKGKDKEKGKGKYLKKTPKLIDRFRIAKWLENHKEELLAERPKYALVAKKCGEELVLDLSGDTMRNTAKACGVFWEEARKSASGDKSAKNPLRNRVAVLYRQVKALRSAFINLCSSLGEPVPVEIADPIWPNLPEPQEPTQQGQP
jgi:hypothetical protein